MKPSVDIRIRAGLKDGVLIVYENSFLPLNKFGVAQLFRKMADKIEEGHIEVVTFEEVSNA